MQPEDAPINRRFWVAIQSNLLVYVDEDARRYFKLDSGVAMAKPVEVMIEDSALYEDTGGENFERFWVDDHALTCFPPHTKANALGSVFSQLH